MPRKSKGPRLYLKKRAGRPPVYVIRDGTNEVSTGCLGDDVDGASKALKAYLEKTFRPNTSEQDLNNIPCSEVLMLYLQDLPADSPSRKTFQYHVKALAPFWGDKTLGQVKGSTCRDYVNTRTRNIAGSLNASLRNVKQSTARHELKTLQAAINHWHRESPLAAVPKVTLPKPGERRERVLERNEVAAMLWACRRLSRKEYQMGNMGVMRRDYSHVARFILIGIYTGTRHDAILRLGWTPTKRGGHVDLDRNVLFRRGYGENETSKRRPPMHIPDRLRHHLVRWRRQYSTVGVHPIVHCNGQPILKMKRAWAAVVKEAGLGPDVTPHVLRHTCASWLLWQGKTIWEVAGVIGADATTVERVYGHHRRVE